MLEKQAGPMLRMAGTSCKLGLLDTRLSYNAVHQAEQVEAFAPPSVHEEVSLFNGRFFLPPESICCRSSHWIMLTGVDVTSVMIE